ncbi:MAG: hypothetical protein ACYDD4_10695 [Acidimicrobiales bacterium]
MKVRMKVDVKVAAHAAAMTPQHHHHALGFRASVGPEIRGDEQALEARQLAYEEGIASRAERCRSGGAR